MLSKALEEATTYQSRKTNSNEEDELDMLLPEEFSCPQCQVDIEPNNTERKIRRLSCPHCEVALDFTSEDAIYSLKRNFVKELVTIYTPEDEIESSAVQSILENAGIENCSVNEVGETI